MCADAKIFPSPWEKGKNFNDRTGVHGEIHTERRHLPHAELACVSAPWGDLSGHAGFGGAMQLRTGRFGGGVVIVIGWKWPGLVG
jgi:hypothetical protein